MPGAGGFQLIEPWSLEQLDGPIDTLGAVHLPCGSYTMQQGVPVVAQFQKSGGWSHSDPLAPFWTAYFADPDLRLPPGTWRISVRASFSLGSCSSGWTTLHASIVIRTTNEPLPTVKP
jgi:hypothetical protein